MSVNNPVSGMRRRRKKRRKTLSELAVTATTERYKNNHVESSNEQKTG